MSASLLDPTFLALLTVVALGRRLVPTRSFAVFGALASALLVSLASPITLLIIGGITVLYLYPLHLLNNRLRDRPNGDRLRRGAVVVGATGLVVMMIVFKVYQQFSLPLTATDDIGRGLRSLVGFSYFLFRALNFLYIQYLVEIRLSTPWCLIFYTLFPPTLTSGPIQKYLDFAKQVESAALPKEGDYGQAVYRITRGYFRKLVVAYLLNEAVSVLLDTSDPGLGRSVGITVCLYLYFYYDFAGYSDIAIGLGHLLGIRVPENFRRPHFASTLTEFWRHWHITLVDWLRDHVFIPLGGMHAGRQRSAALALLIMLLCGLWHGLTPFFVLWGLWHGLHLYLEAWLGLKPTPVTRRSGVRYWSKVAWTNARVALGALLFLPSTTSLLLVLRGFIP